MKHIVCVTRAAAADEKLVLSNILRLLNFIDKWSGKMTS